MQRLSRCLILIVATHLAARGRKDLRDAVAHGAQTENRDSIDRFHNVDAQRVQM
jgi:hypothetical protein